MFRRRRKLAAILSAPAQSQTYALLLGRSRDADGSLVWQPTSPDAPAPAMAVTPDGSKGERLAGSYVGFLSDQKENAGSIFEDGFMIMLKKVRATQVRTVGDCSGLSVCRTTTRLYASTSWRAKISRYSRTNRTVSIRDSHLWMLPADLSLGIGLNIVFLESEWKNPIDGTVMTNPAGFDKYMPEGDQKPLEGPVILESVVLLTPDAAVRLLFFFFFLSSLTCLLLVDIVRR